MSHCVLKHAYTAFRTIRETGELYEWLVDALGAAAYASKVKTFENRIVQQYHSCSSTPVMERVLNNFQKKECTTRCLIATVAFGMGVDVPDVDIVIHWGASKGIVHYWQEIGRCRRDGKQGMAVLYAYRRSLNNRVEMSFKTLCEQMNKGEIACLRKAILEHLTIEQNWVLPSRSVCQGNCETCGCDVCRCCNFCAETCPCFKR